MTFSFVIRGITLYFLLGGGGWLQICPTENFFPGKSWKCWELALSSCNTKILLKVCCSRLGSCSVCPQVHRYVCLTLGRRARESLLMSEGTLHLGFKEHALDLQHTFDIHTSISQCRGIKASLNAIKNHYGETTLLHIKNNRC